ncbi:MAG: carbohydrate binding domain-containing protein [Bryobacteraceae bacterium]|nr:carbohydrate binding domain-containing protein [Bryobacteraceae bacterium]
MLPVLAAGRLIRVGDETVATDRLGSVVHMYGRGLSIVNGGMETGVAPWYAYYGAEASISTVARTGAQSLRVTTPIVDRGVYQEVKDLVPGRTYEFRAWVRAETTSAAAGLCGTGMMLKQRV